MGLGITLTILISLVVAHIGKEEEFGGPQKIILELIGTAQSGISKITTKLAESWEGYIALINTREENKRLREELSKYQATNNEYREAVATNIRLKKLLDLKESLQAPTISAQLIGKDPSIWFETIIIDRGSSDGIQRGMPVVTIEGIVGQVVNVSPHYAKVLLAKDPNSATDAIIQETRIHGIVKGTGDNFFELNYILKNCEVEVGNHLVTSGWGGVFPQGIPVGLISQVVKDAPGMFQQIKIVPAVDFSQLEHVIIILKKNPLTE